MDRRSFLRASDADRERAADRLQQALLEGRIRQDELEERISRVYRSRTYAELDPVLADLPSSSLPATRARAGRLPAWSKPAFGLALVAGLLALATGPPEVAHQFARARGTGGPPAGMLIHSHPDLLPVLAVPVIALAFLVALCVLVARLCSRAFPAADA